MRGETVRRLLLPLWLVAGLSACANNAVQPGIVSTSGSSVASVQKLREVADRVMEQLARRPRFAVAA